MLGKCLYEGMLLELPLAAFFLKKMRGGVCDINDLPSLDPEVYKHLLQLRHYPGDWGCSTHVCGTGGSVCVWGGGLLGKASLSCNQLVSVQVRAVQQFARVSSPSL